MPDMTPLSLRLRVDDPSRLTGADTETALESARAYLSQLRDDVQLTHIEQQSADSIGVILLVGPTVSDPDIAAIAAALRAFLRIGPGRDELMPDEGPEMRDPGYRAIPGAGSRCDQCWAYDGAHLPGCPEG